MSTDHNTDARGLAVWSPTRLDSYDGLALSALAFGIFIRIYRLDAQSLWVDEVFSVLVSARPLSELMSTLVADFVHPPIHYLLLHAWTDAVGGGSLSARAFATLWGIAALPALYVMGREICDRRTASVALALLCISQLGVVYSQEVRPYSQVMFFGILSIWMYARSVRRVSLPSWIGFILSSVFMMGTHYYGVFVLAAIAIWHLVYVRSRLPASWLALAAMIMGGAAASWLASGVVEAALAAEKTIVADQPSWFAVDWSTPFETLSAFGNGRITGVLIAGPRWSISASSALFSGLGMFVLFRSYRIPRATALGFSMMLVAGFGLLSGSGKWWPALLLVMVALPIAEIAGTTFRAPRVFISLWLLLVSGLIVAAELRDAPYWVPFTLGILAVAPLRNCLAQPAGESEARQAHVLLALLVIIPVGALAAAGAVGIQYHVKYVLLALPSFYLLVARGLVHLQPRALRICGIGAPLLFSALGLQTHLEVPYKENYRDALAIVRDGYSEGDCVAFVGPHLAEVPGQWEIYGYGADADLRVLQEAELLSSASECAGVWLVLYGRVPNAVKKGERYEALLSRVRSRLLVRQLHWVRVVHFGARSRVQSRVPPLRSATTARSPSISAYL